ncbi:glycosyltransferase family 39 protein [Kineococcus sp. SYSU DK003]|uniref:glycosyltransferase family 39 protein n=1 Tax=Kineococcus sp. SYSU DK003 TaxID=3383124 RepID=UPI003D7C5F4E
MLRSRGRRPDLLLGLGAVVSALLVFSWRLGTPSPWRDEAVTIAVASRSAGQIRALVQDVDLVHAPFYFLTHALFGADVDIVQARWISVVAASLTAPLLYGLARRAAAPAVPVATARLTGVTAAALFVSMPFASRYAQEARPYALATLVATLGTYLLVRAGSSHRRAWWVAYALSIPVLVALNTVAALVLVAHAGWALAAGRTVRWRAAVAAGTGVVLSVPLLLAQDAQSAQVAFLQRPTVAELGGHVLFALGSSGVAVVVAGLAAALAVWRARARRLVLVGLLWGVLPWPLLWAVSQVTPFWTTRYLVFVVPGTCLLLASVVTVALRRRVPIVVAATLVGAMTVTGLHMQLVFRSPTIGHAEDLRGTADYVATHARPGDGLLFLPDGEYRYRVLTQLYPEVFAPLDDIALERTATESATLVGTTVPARFLWQRMADVQRVWVIGGVGPVVTKTAADRETKRLLDNGYELVSTEEKRAFSVKLYVLDDPAVQSDAGVSQ